MPGVARPASSELVARVQQGLWSERPDIQALEQHLEDVLHLTNAEARAILYRIAASLNSALFPPITKLELIHTEGCNLACTYCFEREMLGYRRMPLDIAKAGVDLLFDYSLEQPFLSISHFGGEPTLNFSAIQSVTEYAEARAAAAGKSIHFDMTSNGTLINEGMARYCAEHKIMVLLSIDGLQPRHDRFRIDKHGRGTFAHAMRGFALMKQYQSWVGVKMTVMPGNVADLYDDVRALYDLGVNQFLIGHATGVTWSEQDIESFGEQFGRVYRWYKESARSDLRITDFEEMEAMEPRFFGCQAAKDNITVHVTGELSPCAKVLALNSKQLVAKLGDVWHGLTHLHNRSELVHCDKLQSACAEKGIADNFKGGCWAENFEDNGNVHAPSLQGHRFSMVRESVCSGCKHH